MESYVEIAFIHNFLTDLLSVWMALYLVQRPLHGGRVTLYALCASAWSAFVFLDIGWIGVAAIETIGFIAVFYRQLALYGVNLLMRTLWHATAFIFWEGSFSLDPHTDLDLLAIVSGCVLLSAHACHDAAAAAIHLWLHIVWKRNDPAERIYGQRQSDAMSASAGRLRECQV